MRALFVSDLHIQNPDDAIARLFEEFLEKCQRVRPSHLFLVGDVFDLWISDRKFFVESYGRIIQRMRGLKESGIEIYYFEGNHDLDLRVFWQSQLQFKVFEGPAYFDLLGKTVRVEHGDEMDPEDKGYLFLRWLLRTPPVRELGRHLPNPAVKFIGEKASHASRDYTSFIKTVTDDEVRAKFLSHIERAHREKAFDLLVSGHVHVVMDESTIVDGKSLRAVNLGTWLKRPVVFDLSANGGRFLDLRDFLEQS